MLLICAVVLVAYVVALMRCGDAHDGGERYLLDFRRTVGLRKINGRWCVTDEHHSIPAD